jgi:hypothetical protein
MRTGDSPRGTLCATLSAASGKEGWENVYFLSPLFPPKAKRGVTSEAMSG